MVTERINTVSGDELMEMDLEPIGFTVEDLIPHGFHIVAGQPKAGKSWLLLLLCLKVSSGETFFGHDTQKGTVLYLCLEDSFTRIRQRLGYLTEDPPANLHFAIMANSLSAGLVDQIELFLYDHPGTRLVVIDTLQKIRNGTGDNYYSSDYKDIGSLKSISDRYGITILAVQHLRKQYDSDPHLMVSGSTGLTGAADGTYVLQKTDINSSEAKLYIRGRDMKEQVLTLHFDKDTCEWECRGSDTPGGNAMKEDPAMQMLIHYLIQNSAFEGTASELIELLNLPVTSNILPKRLNKYQRELKKEGITFERRRTGERREIILSYTPLSDQ